MSRGCNEEGRKSNVLEIQQRFRGEDKVSLGNILADRVYYSSSKTSVGCSISLVLSEKRMSSLRRAVLGQTVNFADIEASLDKLKSLWRDSYRLLDSGQAGWYRRLSTFDRVGVVATAHGITALRMMNDAVPHAPEIVRTLLGQRRDDRAWAFVSNLNDVGVVDATAWVVLALVEWQEEMEFQELDLASKVQGSLDWLEEVALGDGGWGIIPGAVYRGYSTGLAIQALCRGGRRSSRTVERAIQYLVSARDPGTGAWHDAVRRLSVPTTCEIVRALSAAASHDSMYDAELSRACDWLLKTGRQNECWAAGPETACMEEVEVEFRGRRIRVEYGHAPRAVAITALSEAGHSGTPEVVAGTRMLVDDVLGGKWDDTIRAGYTEPTSWMLYDVTTALTTFRKGFSGRTVSVWADNVRVVEHAQDEGLPIRIAKQYWAKLLIVGACAVIVCLLAYFELLGGSVWVTGSFIVSTIVLNYIANFMFELSRHRRQKRS